LRVLLVEELEFQGHTVKSHFRDIKQGYTGAMRKLANEIKAFRADVCLELHFNSASPKAHGFEFLYYKGSRMGKKLANLLSVWYSAKDESFHPFKSKLPFSKRRGTGTLARGRFSRGSTYLRITPCPAIIVETHFGSNIKDHNNAIVTQRQQAKAIARALTEYERLYL